MLEKHELISHLLREFPQFRSRREQDASNAAGPYHDVSLFVRFLTDELYEKKNFAQVQAVFEEMEHFLKEGTSEARELVALGFLETLWTVASWKPYGSDVFLHFLYPASRSVWDKLEAAWNRHFDGCGVLESEILIWRLVRHSLTCSKIIPHQVH